MRLKIKTPRPVEDEAQAPRYHLNSPQRGALTADVFISLRANGRTRDVLLAQGFLRHSIQATSARRSCGDFHRVSPSLSGRLQPTPPGVDGIIRAGTADVKAVALEGGSGKSDWVGRPSQDATQRHRDAKTQGRARFFRRRLCRPPGRHFPSLRVSGVRSLDRFTAARLLEKLLGTTGREGLLHTVPSHLRDFAISR